MGSPAHAAEVTAWEQAIEAPLGPYSGRSDLSESVSLLAYDDGEISATFVTFRTFAMLVGLALQTKFSSGWDACLVGNYLLYCLICDARSLECLTLSDIALVAREVVNLLLVDDWDCPEAPFAALSQAVCLSWSGDSVGAREAVALALRVYREARCRAYGRYCYNGIFELTPYDRLVDHWHILLRSSLSGVDDESLEFLI